MNVYIEVYGCTANKSDASLIRGLLEENNYKIVKKPDEADIIIILTCTVIGTTEQRMLSRLKNLKEYSKKIIVTGCMASVQEELLKSIDSNIKILLPQYTAHIIDIIENKKLPNIPKDKTIFKKTYEDVFAPIAISEGCLFSCTYCITSIARGKLRSFPKEGIKKDVSSAVYKGCKEIQITAQDTSSYGLDTNQNLGELIKTILTIEGNFKIRIGMMNPYTCLKNLDNIINSYNDTKIYKFVHLPVQSGDNEILKKMNRKYNVNDFKSIVKSFRDKYPKITLSTDIIVGFPGETDAQFNHTIELLEEIKPDITNITRFSARPRTKAKVMKGRIKTDIVKQRSRILTDLCSNISKENNEKEIDKNFNILITEKGKKNTYVGRNENYKPVVIKEKVNIGEFINVKITKTYPTYLVGSII